MFDFLHIGQYLAAFALVIGLIGLMGMILRRFSDPAMRARKREDARLQVVETLAIDPRSRLFIIRRDDMEHLLVKSGDRFEVIETDIPVVEEVETDEPTLLTRKKERDADAA